MSQTSRNLIRTVMKAIRVSQFGGGDALKLECDVPVPKPADNQVLVRVHAAGVNPVDTYIRSGNYARLPPLPYTPGIDGAGVIEDVGPAVTNYKRGDRVYFVYGRTGSYAEYATTQDPLLSRLGDRLSFAEGASIGIPYYTAHRALFKKGEAKSGQTVLVHGASGGVGSAACQIAAAHGMTVIGTAGTEAGLVHVKQNGATHVFNHREQGYIDKIRECTGGAGPDLILEMLANVNLENDLELIKHNGHIVIIGSRGSVEITPRHIMGKEVTVRGVMLGNIAASPAQYLADWQEMHKSFQDGIAAGWVKPVVGKTFPLSDAKLAHEAIMDPAGHAGRIVLEM